MTDTTEPRQGYTAPRFAVLGGVEELTLGLSGIKHEPHGKIRFGPGNGPKKTPPGQGKKL